MVYRSDLQPGALRAIVKLQLPAFLTWFAHNRRINLPNISLNTPKANLKVSKSVHEWSLMTGESQNVIIIHKLGEKRKICSCLSAMMTLKAYVHGCNVAGGGGGGAGGF